MTVPSNEKWAGGEMPRPFPFFPPVKRADAGAHRRTPAHSRDGATWTEPRTQRACGLGRLRQKGASERHFRKSSIQGERPRWGFKRTGAARHVKRTHRGHSFRNPRQDTESLQLNRTRRTRAIAGPAKPSSAVMENHVGPAETRKPRPDWAPKAQCAASSTVGPNSTFPS